MRVKLFGRFDERNVRCEPVIFDRVTGNGNVKVYGQKPYYATKYAACADVAVPEKTVIPAGKAVKVPLLLGFMIPEGYKIIMYPRSSLLIKHGLVQPVSVIDSDYSGMEVHVPLLNPGGEDVTLEKGERVAQIECVPMYDCLSWHRYAETRKGGFGSTGSKNKAGEDSND